MGSYFLKMTAETVKFLSNLSVLSLNCEGRFAMSSHFFILLKNSIKLKKNEQVRSEKWWVVGVLCLCVCGFVVVCLLVYFWREVYVALLVVCVLFFFPVKYTMYFTYLQQKCNFCFPIYRQNSGMANMTRYSQPLLHP